jgi:hypothetical protein
LLPGYDTLEQHQRHTGRRSVTRLNRRRRDFVAGLRLKVSESLQLGSGTGIAWGPRPRLTTLNSLWMMAVAYR